MHGKVVRDFLKRTFDLSISLPAAILLLPVLAVIAVAIKLTSKGPTIFRQERAGKEGKPFVFYKFRTMRTGVDPFGASPKSGEDPRLTKIGKFLREYSLDELPQLFNVLKGDMSVIGPRPERPFFVEKLRKIIPLYSKRLEVKPGITGLAQVKHKYDSNIDDVVIKLRYDFDYINNLSILHDFNILFSTLLIIIMGKGRL